jgi:Uma2 family endonuclease
MPTTTTPTQERQERWQEIASDPLLSELPYKVETNQRGQIVLSPHKNRHSVAQNQIQNLLGEHAPEGLSPTELAIATPQGTRAADVVWMSPGRWEEMQATGDPTTLAPEICVEVMSDSNDWEEMREKRRLYVEAGAEEVWVVGEGGAVWFWDSSGQLDSSEIAPDFPNQL